jgi:hypothetical protein
MRPVILALACVFIALPVFAQTAAQTAAQTTQQPEWPMRTKPPLPPPH